MSFGTVGYPDGQRVSQSTDFAPIWSIVNSLPPPIGPPTVYISNYGYVAMSARVTGAPIGLFLNWWLEQAGINLLAQDIFTLDPSIAAAAKITLPALGSFLTVTVTSAAPGTYTPTIHAYLTNQARGRTVSAARGIVYAQAAVNIAAGATVTQAATQYGSGFCGAMVNGGSQGVNVELDYMQHGTFTWIPFAAWSVAAGVVDYRTIIFPALATRMLLTNPSGVNPSNAVAVQVIQEA